MEETVETDERINEIKYIQDKEDVIKHMEHNLYPGADEEKEETKEEILYNMQPVTEKYETVWIPINCECGSNKVRHIKRITTKKVSDSKTFGYKCIAFHNYKCANCGKEIEF